MANEVHVHVERSVWWEFHQTMSDAKENAAELLRQHLETEGDETKKGRCVANMFKREIENLERLLIYLEKNNGIPF